MTRRQPPADPAVRDLVRMARRAGLSRRALLGMTGAGALAAVTAACAPPKPPAGGAAAKVQLPVDVSDTDKIVNWANWTAYLDYDDKTKTYPTLEAFSKQTGIKASYSEDIDDNDSYVNKISPQLRAKQDINRDIMVLTDWMANRVIRDELVQPLDLISMKNVWRLRPSLQEVSFDPGRQHSITWQSGFAGLAYDKTKTSPVKAIADLWRSDLKGRVVVLSEFRDTVGLIMQSQGVDISKDFTKAQVEKGMDEISKRISDGNIRRVKGNAYLEDLKAGNAVAGIVWSGDMFVLRAETGNDNWEFVIPDSGGTLWSDNMMLPITARHRKNAHKLIDYYYDPAVAAEVAAYVNYVCPVEGAQAEMEKLDKDLAQSPFIFPTESYIKEHKIQGFRALSASEDADYSAMWAKVVGN